MRPLNIAVRDLVSDGKRTIVREDELEKGRNFDVVCSRTMKICRVTEQLRELVEA